MITPMTPMEPKSMNGAVEKVRMPKDPRALEETARSLESVFMNLLLSSMRKTVTKSSVFSGGRGEEIFTGLFDNVIAEESTRGKSVLGLAKMIVKKYSKNLPVLEGRNGNAVDIKP